MIFHEILKLAQYRKELDCIFEGGGNLFLDKITNIVFIFVSCFEYNSRKYPDMLVSKDAFILNNRRITTCTSGFYIAQNIWEFFTKEDNVLFSIFETENMSTVFYSRPGYTVLCKYGYYLTLPTENVLRHAFSNKLIKLDKTLRGEWLSNGSFFYDKNKASTRSGIRPLDKKMAVRPIICLKPNTELKNDDVAF